ncbi:MAG: hypothetical protein HUU54_13375 [Ignavibacteriaceae bacterium]|nr:hypothetical protein [Ignavibacteriaceae bacterium]
MKVNRKIKTDLHEQTALGILSVCCKEPNKIDLIAPHIDAFPEAYKGLVSFLTGLNDQEKNDILFRAAKLDAKTYQLFTEAFAYLPDKTLDIEGYEIPKLYEISHSLLAEEIFSNLLSESQNSIDGLSILEDGISKLTEIKDKLATKFKGEKSLLDQYDQIRQRYEHNSKENFYQYFLTDYPGVNKVTGGFRPGNYLGIAGLYKSGKTTLALNWIIDFAMQGISGAIFTKEMTTSEMQDKIISIITGIPSGTLRNPVNLTGEQITKFNVAEHKCNDILRNIFISEGDFTEVSIKSKIKAYSQRKNVKIFMIDYLGLIDSARKFDSTYSKLDYISSFFKQTAIDLNVVIIMTAQLNREGFTNAKTGNKIPSFGNLAGSLALARDVDYGFITINPIATGLESIPSAPGSKEKINFDKNDFVLKMDISRHTEGNQYISLRLNEFGQMSEYSKKNNQSPF